MSKQKKVPKGFVLSPDRDMVSETAWRLSTPDDQYLYYKEKKHAWLYIDEWVKRQEKKLK